MGWFGVLKAEGGPPFLVKKCHINLWALPTFQPGRRLFHFDVGLEVLADEEEVRDLYVMLPFDAEEPAWRGQEPIVQDLFMPVADADVASLIFGGPVSVAGEGRKRELTMADETKLHLIGVNAPRAGRDTDITRRDDLSLWRVPLLEPIPPKESRYVRVRWHVFRPGTTWRWKRTVLGRSGAQIDFRISDVRESKHAATEYEYWDRVMPVESVNFFVVVTRRFRPRVASPALRYIRPLEGGDWKKYAEGMDYATLRGLLVHYWRYPGSDDKQSAPLLAEDALDEDNAESKAAPITQKDPFRAFLDLSHDIAAPVWGMFARNVLAVIAGVGLFEAAPALWRWFTGLDFNILNIVTAIVGTTVLGALSLLAWLFGLMKERARKPRLWFRAIERRGLRLLNAMR